MYVFQKLVLKQSCVWLLLGLLFMGVPACGPVIRLNDDHKGSWLSEMFSRGPRAPKIYPVAVGYIPSLRKR